MFLLADIGGTKTRIARSMDLVSFDAPIKIDTPEHYEDGVTQILAAMRTLAGEEKVEAIALGMPGVIVPGKRVLHDSNMPEWDGKPLVDDIESALQTRVEALNDTALVGLGEATAGAGQGASIVVYMTISTGVNAARILDGRIEPYTYGSETGEQFIYVEGKELRLGDVISGKAISRKYGMQPKELGKDSPVWEHLAEYAAYGVYNAIVHWSPERFVIGGSMTNEIGISVDRIAAHVQRLNKKYPSLPEIVHSSLEDLGGLYGGLALLKQRL